MQFVVAFRTGGSPVATEFPQAKLVQDNWDDFGYKTTFYATLYLSQRETIDLGNVKILEESQTSGYTPVPKEPFERLGLNFCSLGGDLDYYEKLFKLGRTVYSPYLHGLSDAAYGDEIRARFEDLEGHRASLLRFGGAEPSGEAAYVIDGLLYHEADLNCARRSSFLRAA